LYDSYVGYCQGLAFLVGPLLMNVSVWSAEAKWNGMKKKNCEASVNLMRRSLDAWAKGILCICSVSPPSLTVCILTDKQLIFEHPLSFQQ
jgi:hypothetical protein